MNRFEGVCDECPLRTKVDVARANESVSMGSDGVISRLADGNERYDVVMAVGEVCDSDTVWAVESDLMGRIEDCEGPTENLLRKQCAVGLASAWRWSESKGKYEPNVNSADEIVPLLRPAGRRDAMPHYDKPTWLVGDFCELDCGTHSAFRNLGIMKLADGVQGTGAKLGKGRAVMLDIVRGVAAEDISDNIYRVRVAQGGPHFAFRSETGPDGKDGNLEELFAEGLQAYLNSDGEAMQVSEEMIGAAESAKAQRDAELNRWMAGGGLRRALEEGIRTQSDEDK